MTDWAAVLGRLVAVPLAALARWRRGKPMHPRGLVCTGVLTRHGRPAPWGVPWLDGTGRDDVVVRLSRGIGLPPPLPDLLGLAVRAAGPVDLLLATSGSGPVGRLIPLPRTRPDSIRGSIMGYRSDGGTLRLAAFPLAGDGSAFTLAAARRSGPWQAFARLDLALPGRHEDCDVRFDAVLNPPPGLVADGPMARFRAPAYAAARRARDLASR